MSAQDPCCGRCKTPWGVCATKFACAHHRAAILRDRENERIAQLDAELRAAGNLDRRRK